MENIVQTLVGQHRVLQQNLADVYALTNDAEKIASGLDEFSNNLSDHLKLEGGIFYPELLKRMETKGMDISKTKEFIAEMNKIAVVINSFLKRYNAPEAIEEEMNRFKKELKEIIDVLKLRIESEESGIFTYWFNV